MDSYYSKEYSNKSLEQLKGILKHFEPYVSYTDENGRKTIVNRSDEYEWLQKRVSELENPPKLAPEKESPAPGAPKGGKTRKYRKGSKKTMKKSKRRHRK